MKKFYTLLAASAVVLSAAAAAPIAQKELVNTTLTPSAMANKFLNRADMEIAQKQLDRREALSRTVSPEFTPQGSYITELTGWYKVPGADGKYATGALETGDATTDAATLDSELVGYPNNLSYVTIDENKIVLEGLAYENLVVEGELYVHQFTDEAGNVLGEQTIFIVESGANAYFIDEDGKPTGDPVVLFEYDIPDQAINQYIYFYVYEPGRYIFWESDFPEDMQLQSVADYINGYQRLIVANSMDMAGADYTEYSRAIFLVSNRVNALQYFDARFPNKTQFSSTGAFVYAEFEDVSEEENWVTLYNGFCVFNTQTFNPVDYFIDIEAGTGLVEDQAIANVNYPLYAYYLWAWDGDDDNKPEDTIMEANFRSITTPSGNPATLMYQQYAAISTMSLPADNTLYLKNIECTMPFVIEGLPEYDGIKTVAVDNENAPVEYFNLQGVRVANPETGIYIRRQGNNVTKVLVK